MSSKPSQGIGAVLLNLLRIRRVEFRIAEIPILLIPAFLELALGAAPAPVWVWVEAFFAFFFLFAFGDMINCLADRDLDARYKKHLSDAVYALGLPFVTAQIVVSALAALGIAVHLAFALNRWLLVPVVIVGLLLGAAYSVEPVRLKGRGIWHLICLWLIVLFGPMLFISLLLRSFPSAGLLVFAAAYATIQMGIILVNSAEDYPEDREAGVRNTVVAYGLVASMNGAVAMVAAGGLGLLITLTVLYGSVGAATLYWSAILPLLGATLFVFADIFLVSRSLLVATEETQITRVKYAAKRVPIWITLVAWASFIAVYVFYRMT
jgi:4-hydroxybenzoate polyprenyltransferase